MNFERERRMDFLMARPPCLVKLSKILCGTTFVRMRLESHLLECTCDLCIWTVPIQHDDDMVLHRHSLDQADKGSLCQLNSRSNHLCATEF